MPADNAKSETSHVSQQDYETLAAFRHALRRFLAFSEQAARAQGLTPQQHQAILAIKGRSGGPATVGDLAEQLLIRHHSAVELTDRLVEGGLVGRAGNADDRRSVTLTLTEKAEGILEQLSATHLSELRLSRGLLARLIKRLELS